HLTNVEQLLLSPDGSLNLVPMAALLDERGEYLAKRFEVTYLTSGRDLLRVDSNPQTQSGPAIFADPNFGNPGNLLAQNALPPQAPRSVDLDRSGLVFRPLANTALEAETLTALLKLDSSHVFLGDNATESQLKQLHGPRILHVATHGFFLSDQELAH